MGLREDIQGYDDGVIEPVPVPEWGGKVIYVRAIEGHERDKFEEASLVKKGKNKEASLRNIRARLVVLAACRGPADPAPLFLPGDEEWVGKKAAKALDRLYEAAARLSGIRDEDIEELVKNSESGPNCNSGLSLATDTEPPSRS